MRQPVITLGSGLWILPWQFYKTSKRRKRQRSLRRYALHSRYALQSRHTGTDAEKMQHSYAERVGALAEHDQADRVLFQSLAVTVLQTLERVRWHERQVEAAGISLAQREKLARMIASLEATTSALQGLLSVQGAKMRDVSAGGDRTKKGETLWWFALVEALQVLEISIEQIASIVSNQPKGSPARTLAGVAAQLLHTHYNKLLEEAEQWMG